MQSVLETLKVVQQSDIASDGQPVIAFEPSQMIRLLPEIAKTLAYPSRKTPNLWTPKRSMPSGSSSVRPRKKGA